MKAVALLAPLVSAAVAEPTEESAAVGAETLASGLNPLLLEGGDLHPSLKTRPIESVRDWPTRVAPPRNPHVSTDDPFVEDIARGSSQGKLDAEGIRSALYALYSSGEDAVLLYGLEARSDSDADRRERALRRIWAYTESLDRAYVHRKDVILVVVWHGGVSPECWESVIATVVERLNDPAACR